MRHQKTYRKLGRTSKNRDAMLTNLSISLLLYEKVETTEAKAKEVRRKAEKLITKSKSDTLNNRRLVLASVRNNQLVTKKLFEVLGPRFSDRAGGYTSIIKLSQRVGDRAPMVSLQLVSQD